jgi:ABC-type nitrate/sulfonate/bicarbonate transport system substrate-binding protein
MQKDNSKKTGRTIANSPLSFILVAIAAITLVAIATTVGMNGCSQDRVKTTEPPKATVVIAYSQSPAAAPVLLADALGYWEGDPVKTKGFVAGQLCFDSVLGGNAELGTVAETPLVYGAIGGADYRILATFTHSTKHLRCIARVGEKPVEPMDLKGKTVGVLLGSVSEFFMDKFFDAYGLSRDQVKVVNLKPPEMVSALVAGGIDAAFVWEPFISEAQERSGDKIAVLGNGEGYTMTFNLVCRPDFVEKHPDQAAAVLRSLIRTHEYIKNNRERSIEIAAERLGMERKVLANIWDGYDFSVVLDDRLLKTMEEQAAWVRRRDKSNSGSLPNFRNFIANGPLQSIRDNL